MAWLLANPTTARAYETDLRNPALAEALRIRDIVDGAAITMGGAFVAAYEMDGIHSQHHDDEARNRTKEALEAVLRALPERSMRMHLRFEVREDGRRRSRSSRTSPGT
jgi:hypothetical protein